MNIALTKIYAAASANLCGRYSLARQAALACALAGAGMSAASAGPGDRDAQRNQPAPQMQVPREPARSERPQLAPAPPSRGEARQFDSRAFEARADEQRRQLQMQQEQNAHNAEAGRRSGRLTPDERRDLRRQINEAGIDLYPNTPRR
jgi:hypothetical protein